MKLRKRRTGKNIKHTKPQNGLNCTKTKKNSKSASTRKKKNWIYFGNKIEKENIGIVDGARKTNFLCEEKSENSVIEILTSFYEMLKEMKLKT